MVNIQRSASVKVQGLDSLVKILITSKSKPEISSQIRSKWQNILNVLAECLSVPAGLIMQLDEEKISVFLSSKTEGNPYKTGECEKLQHGLYCESVVGTNYRLLVPDARDDVLWENNPDIKLGMVSYLGFPVKWPDGEIFGTLCVLDCRKNSFSEKYINLMEILKDSIEDDLSNLLSNYNELLNAYENLERNMENLSRLNKTLEKTLAEKEILMSEIHHRVKNNMQIISSLIDLQSGKSEGGLIGDEFTAIRNRIKAMGIVHEILYNANDFKQLNMKDYISNLVENLDISLAINNVNHEYKILIEDNLSINLETAIPIGLIVNEIITNSIKHAFPDNKSGTILIKIGKDNNGRYSLEITDNGCGIPEGFVKDNPKGLGLVLVELLVKQLGGSFALKNKNGVQYLISFRETKKEEIRWAEGS